MLSVINILSLILLLVLAGFAFVLLEPLGTIMRLRGAPAGPIGALPETGPAKAAGRASGSALTSPIAEAACVLWQLEVQEYRSNGKSGRWVSILTQASSAPIALDDGTGRVAVVPSGAKLMLGDDYTAGGRMFERMPPDVEAALERMGVPLRGMFGFKRRLRMRERWVAAGEQVFALGLAERAGGELRLCSTAGAPLILADRDEATLLGSLYRRVAITFAFALVAVAMIGFFISQV